MLTYALLKAVGLNTIHEQLSYVFTINQRKIPLEIKKLPK